ncbi:MAG: Fur family transcriptional regulator [Pseudomonadota bacterium]
MARRKGRMEDDVLALLNQHDQPQSAYALLDQMRLNNPKLAPTSIYRALSALTERGAVRRLESMKAFVVCRHGDEVDNCVMAICDECGTVEEHVAPSLIDDVSAEAAKSGFAPTRHVIEVHGRCSDCRFEGEVE